MVKRGGGGTKLVRVFPCLILYSLLKDPTARRILAKALAWRQYHAIADGSVSLGHMDQTNPHAYMKQNGSLMQPHGSADKTP